MSLSIFQAVDATTSDIGGGEEIVPYRKRTVAGLACSRVEAQVIHSSVIDSSPEQTANRIILNGDGSAEYARKQRAAQQPGR